MFGINLDTVRGDIGTNRSPGLIPSTRNAVFDSTILPASSSLSVAFILISYHNRQPPANLTRPSLSNDRNSSLARRANRTNLRVGKPGRVLIIDREITPKKEKEGINDSE